MQLQFSHRTFSGHFGQISSTPFGIVQECMTKHPTDITPRVQKSMWGVRPRIPKWACGLCPLGVLSVYHSSISDVIMLITFLPQLEIKPVILPVRPAHYQVASYKNQQYKFVLYTPVSVYSTYLSSYTASQFLIITSGVGLVLNFEFSKMERTFGIWAIKTIYKELNRSILKRIPLNP